MTINKKQIRYLTSALAACLLLLTHFSLNAAMYGRKTFRGSGDGNRNVAIVESAAQLQSTWSVTSALTTQADLSLDSVQDNPSLEVTVDLTKLTTGFADRDPQVFSRSFLDFASTGSATFKLVNLNRSRTWVLNNEQKEEFSGIGELRLGSMADTVAISLNLTYLQQNDLTRGRMAGDLLHMVGDMSFRLSRLGIKIPQEALLKLDDVIRLRFDAFASTQ